MLTDVLELAALPFLPNGKGALILILGGLAVLPVSLLWSRVGQGSSPQALQRSPQTQWIAGVEVAAARLGLGPCRVVVADATHCIVALPYCRTCQQKGARRGACERERRGLHTAVATSAPQATVVEVVCNRRGACTFEVRKGRSA